MPYLESTATADNYTQTHRLTQNEARRLLLRERKYNFQSLKIIFQDGLTFPCYYSQMNPWIVLSSYNE